MCLNKCREIVPVENIVVYKFLEEINSNRGYYSGCGLRSPYYRYYYKIGERREINILYKGDDIFSISGDTFAVMKGGGNRPFLINMDNPLPLVDYHTSNISYMHIMQPISIHNPETGDNIFYGLVKFEATSEEPVVINYPIGSGNYSTKNAIEGTLKLENGTEYEKVYLAKEAGSSLLFEKFDKEESGNIYVDGFYAECYYIPTPNVDGYKVTSIVPGVAYCQENDTVLYNDTWNSVTLVYPDMGIEKKYKTNFVTLNQLKDDFAPGSSRYPYITEDVPEGKYFIKVPLSDVGNSGYVFFKESDGMTFEVSNLY